MSTTYVAAIHELVEIFRVPLEYVMGITDTGLSREVDADGNVLDVDDLRLAIELPAGHLLIIQPRQMLSVEADYVVISEWKRRPTEG